MSALPEVFPQVSVGIGHGEHLESVDIDLHAITAHLREGGLDDEAILGLSIDITDKEPQLNPHNGTFAIGQYLRTDHSIATYHGDDVADVGATWIGAEHAALEASSAINDTLTHELEHAIATYDEELQEQTRLFSRRQLMRHRVRAFGGFVLGTGGAFTASIVANMDPTSSIYGSTIVGCIASGIAGRRFIKKNLLSFYYDSPEEIRCRAVQENNTISFVTLQSKREPAFATSA